MIDWHTRTFASVEELRKLASKEEYLATAAKEDGDFGHAAYHKQLAADYREEARVKEANALQEPQP